MRDLEIQWDADDSHEGAKITLIISYVNDLTSVSHCAAFQAADLKLGENNLWAHHRVINELFHTGDGRKPPNCVCEGSRQFPTLKLILF